MRQESAHITRIVIRLFGINNDLQQAAMAMYQLTITLGITQTQIDYLSLATQRATLVAIYLEGYCCSRAALLSINRINNNLTIFLAGPNSLYIWYGSLPRSAVFGPPIAFVCCSLFLQVTVPCLPQYQIYGLTNGRHVLTRL
jgi:hypothetical protein